MARRTRDETSRGVADSRSEQDLARLFARAGRRPELPRDELERIEHRVRTEWLQRYGGGSPRVSKAVGWRLTLAAVALIAVCVGGGWWLLWRSDSAGTPGTAALVVERVTGAAVLGRVVAGEEETGPLRPGQDVPVGARMHTLALDGEPTRVALQSAAGASIRLDVGTRMRVVSQRVLELESGAVYIDSPPQSGSDLVVRTALGSVREVGTQFEVRLLDAETPTMQVRVREGRVEVDTSTESREAVEGRQIVVGLGGVWRESELASATEEWRWVLETASFDVEGRTVGELLAWVARETGWQVTYRDPAVAEAVDEIVIRGAFDDLRPDEAHDLVLPAAGLTASRSGDRLEVARAEESTPRL